jgi:hypothetical protein
MLDLARLAKIWKLTNSPNPGEAAAARDRARAIVEREGKTLADVPGLLRATQKSAPAKPAPATAGFADFGDWMEEREPGYKARFAKEQAERRQREKDELQEVLARYGSEEAVITLSPTEAVLRAAVLKWCVFQKPPYDTRWIAEIDGRDEPYPLDKMTPRVRKALSAAIPVPTTITEAFAEYTMWEKRDRERALVFGSVGDRQLDLPSAFRMEIVRNLLEVGLRAASVEEVLIRQRYTIDSQMSQPEIDQAVLLDLEGLVAAKAIAKITSRQRRRDRGGRQCGHDSPDRANLICSADLLILVGKRSCRSQCGWDVRGSFDALLDRHILLFAGLAPRPAAHRSHPERCPVHRGRGSGCSCFSSPASCSGSSECFTRGSSSAMRRQIAGRSRNSITATAGMTLPNARRLEPLFAKVSKEQAVKSGNQNDFTHREDR